MAIILDAMGSDQYPVPEIEAAIYLAEKNIEVILVGNKEIIEPKLKELNKSNYPIRFHHAPDMLEMGEKAVESARKKPLNSMSIGLEFVKNGEAQAFVTAGNTGAAMFTSLKSLGRIKGVQRPALTVLFPVKDGNCVVLDIGANADCRPDFLVQFAIMGSLYAQKILKKENPRVGLLSNGEEPGKGNTLVKETFPLLKECGVNFIGNVEGKELYGGEADVVVTDGFTGNVLLKSSEAVAKLLTDILKKELMASFVTKMGALLAGSALKALKKTLDPGAIGAAPLLGIDGLVFVGHGRSDSRALINAVLLAKQAVDNHLMDAMREAIQAKLG